MTFTNSSDSMSTLAHELGHAYHSHVLREQPVFLQDYPMNLAETASTFAEAVLNEQRLATAQAAATSFRTPVAGGAARAARTACWGMPSSI